MRKDTIQLLQPNLRRSTSSVSLLGSRFRRLLRRNFLRWSLLVHRGGLLHNFLHRRTILGWSLFRSDLLRLRLGSLLHHNRLLHRSLQSNLALSRGSHLHRHRTLLLDRLDRRRSSLRGSTTLTRLHWRWSLTLTCSRWNGCTLSCLTLHRGHSLLPALGRFGILLHRPRTTQMDRRRRGWRRMRLQISLHLLWRCQLAIHQLKEQLVQQFLIDRKVRNNPHLLHHHVRDLLLCLCPLGKEALELRLNPRILRRMRDP